jgi:hypothetical protein
VGEIPTPNAVLSYLFSVVLARDNTRARTTKGARAAVLRLSRSCSRGAVLSLHLYKETSMSWSQSTHATCMVDGLLIDSAPSTLQLSTVEVGALAECGCVNHVWIHYSLPMEIGGSRLMSKVTTQSQPCAQHATRRSRKKSHTRSSRPSTDEATNGKIGSDSMTESARWDSWMHSVLNNPYRAPTS